MTLITSYKEEFVLYNNKLAVVFVRHESTKQEWENRHRLRAGTYLSIFSLFCLQWVMSFLQRRFSWLPKALPDGLRSEWTRGSFVNECLCTLWNVTDSAALELFVCILCVSCESVRPPSCPRLRRTISCLAPMLPSMASSSLAFMSLDFLNVRLFIRSKAFFPCMVNTTWALYPWRRRRADREKTAGKSIAAQHSASEAS